MLVVELVEDLVVALVALVWTCKSDKINEVAKLVIIIVKFCDIYPEIIKKTSSTKGFT